MPILNRTAVVAVPACIARCLATGPRTIAVKKVKPAHDQNDYGQETDEETAPGWRAPGGTRRRVAWCRQASAIANTGMMMKNRPIAGIQFPQNNDRSGGSY